MSFSAPPRHILHMIVAGFEPPTVWSVACGLDHSATGSGGRLKFPGRAKERKRYEETRTSYRESCGDQAYSPTRPRREDFFRFKRKATFGAADRTGNRITRRERPTTKKAQLKGGSPDNPLRHFTHHFRHGYPCITSLEKPSYVTSFLHRWTVGASTKM